MNKIVKYILALSLTILGLSSVSAQSAFRVMSMNIREGGERASYKSKPFADCINEYKPDFVCLQEVDNKTNRNGKRDWLNEVAMQTGMFPLFVKSMDYRDGGFGVAILSKYPFYKSGYIISTFPITNGKKVEPRGTGYIYVMLPDGQPLRVIFTHLALGMDNIKKNIADINTYILEQDLDTPSLLLGDMNCDEGTSASNYLLATWQDLGYQTGKTFPVDKLEQRIDYITGYPKRTFARTDFQVVAHPELSDHCFIIADLKIK